MVEDLVKRWRRAAERAAEEQVRILRFDTGYVATSTSRPLGYYRLAHSPSGWSCECTANAGYHLPCKHLSALADVLDLDILSDVQVEWPPVGTETTAA